MPACAGGQRLCAGVEHAAPGVDGERTLETEKREFFLLSRPNTGDVYTDWDVEQLAESLLEAVQDDDIGIVPQGASGTRMVEPKMEAAGIEPASAVAPNRASTSVVRA